MSYKSKTKKRAYNRWRYREIAKKSWSTSRKTSYRLWTKNEIIKVMKLWDDNTFEEMCSKLNRSKGQIMYMATNIRKAGFHLPKKMNRGILRSLVIEAVKQFKGREKL